MKFIKALATLALTTVAAASFAAPNTIDAAKVTSSKTVQYKCQEGKFSVKYGFNAAGIPVNATAKINGAARVLKYDMAESNDVTIVFKDKRGYKLDGDAFERHNAGKGGIMVTSPDNDLVFEACSPR